LGPHVDLFLCETMSSSPEAFASLKGAEAAGKPVWVALTVHEMGPATIRGGEAVGPVAARLYERGAAAVLINCTAPEQVDPAMAEIAAVAGDRPFGAYANAFLPTPPDYGLGDTVDHPGMRTDLDAATYAAHAMRWVDAGATIVGGCCGVGPAYIEAVAAALKGPR
ncbi:MAG: homocysteine S-methyltransferase family protein, partial [Pseudomonadota bacterium]